MPLDNSNRINNFATTPISGVWGSVFISHNDVLYYFARSNKWFINPRREYIPAPHGESCGWETGVTSITGANLLLTGVYSVYKQTGQIYEVHEILVPGRVFLFELNAYDTATWNPTVSLPLLYPWFGVAEVISTEFEHTVRGVKTYQVHSRTRGPISRPDRPLTTEQLTTLFAKYRYSFDIGSNTLA